MKTKVYSLSLTALLFCLFVAIAGLTSCSDDVESDDGDWEPMEWQTDAEMKKDHSIAVPGEGGEYKFICSNNYPVWISSVSEDEKDYIPDNRFYLNCEWIKVHVHNDKVMIVSLSPNDSGVKRTAKVRVSGGDIFDYFEFIQEF